MPFFEDRDYPDEPRVDARTHICQVEDLDYSQVDHGRIACTVCFRVWNFVTKWPKGWWPSPCPKCGIPAERCFHYGKKKYTKSYES